MIWNLRQAGWENIHYQFNLREAEQLHCGVRKQLFWNPSHLHNQESSVFDDSWCRCVKLRHDVSSLGWKKKDVDWLPMITEGILTTKSSHGFQNSLLMNIARFRRTYLRRYNLTICISTVFCWVSGREISADMA